MTEHRVPLKLPGPLQELFRPPPTPGVLGVFAHLDATVESIKKLQGGGYKDLTVYSPIPRHELEDVLAQPVSPVRMWTLIGGISGCAFGAWLTLYMSYDWPLVVGGKPIGSIPPYVVIMFEMTKSAVMLVRTFLNHRSHGRNALQMFIVQPAHQKRPNARYQNASRSGVGPPYHAT